MQFELWAREGRDGSPEYHLLVPTDPRYRSERSRLGEAAELVETFDAEDHREALELSDELIRRRVEAWEQSESKRSDAS